MSFLMLSITNCPAPLKTLCIESVGLEEPDDIIADLDQALNKMHARNAVKSIVKDARTREPESILG